MGSKAIAVHKNKVLLILRDNIPTIKEPNKWDLPGGIKEEGESFDACLKREFFEELSIVPSNIKYFGKDNSTFGDTVAIYIVQLTDEEADNLTLGNEGQCFNFFALDELPVQELGFKLKTALNQYRQHFNGSFEKIAALDPALFNLVR